MAGVSTDERVKSEEAKALCLTVMLEVASIEVDSWIDGTEDATVGTVV